MNKFVGKICPYCKSEFTASDIVVVCSECDMPHHKDCWVDNQGCTTFGCLGTIKSADESLDDNYIDLTFEQTNESFFTKTPIFYNTENQTSSYNTTMNQTMNNSNMQSSALQYCAKCGVLNDKVNRFCTKCGASMYGFITGNNPVENMLIQVKTEYYNPRFQKLRSQDSMIDWNWCAFLVTPYWFIYRKMYLEGYILLGTLFMMSFLGIFGSLFSWGIYIAGGMTGNYLYMKHIEKLVQETGYMQEGYKGAFCRQKGGVNSGVTAATIVIYFFILLFFLNL